MCFFLTIRFRNVKDGFVWLFTYIYGAYDASDCDQFWQEITVSMTTIHEPWCLGRDWNAVLIQSEKNRSGGRTNNRRRFRNFLNS